MESLMAISLEEISTITAKGQTTIPKAVRQALGVNYGGHIAFRVSVGGLPSAVPTTTKIRQSTVS